MRVTLRWEWDGPELQWDVVQVSGDVTFDPDGYGVVSGLEAIDIRRGRAWDGPLDEAEEALIEEAARLVALRGGAA